MNMKNNVHLVPVVVLDTVDMLSDPRRGQNEKDQLRLRLVAIRDYCNDAIAKHDRVIGEPTRGFALGSSKKKRT